MNVGKVLGAIFGVLLIILGIWCIMTPVETYGALAWMLGLAMIVDGVANLANWDQLRRMDMWNGWTIAAAVISIILGVILLISLGARLAVDLFIAILAAIWLIAVGVMRIASGITLRNIHKKGGVEEIGKRWWLVVILGALIVLVGILSLFNPIVIVFGIGVFMGFCIITAGLATLGFAIS